MKRGFLFIFCLIPFFALAQQGAWVFFKDKASEPFDPYSYFDVKAVERRIINELPLYDFSDLPVKEEYINTVSQNSEEFIYASRWLNAVAIKANEAQLEKIKSFSFVSEIQLIGTATIVCAEDWNKKLEKSEQEVLIKQTARMGLNNFKNRQLDGKGVRIAILDAGFPSVDKNPAFEHIRNRNGIIATYDFVSKKEFVYAHAAHGTEVMSCIAGMVDSMNIGMATGAEFLLARTEDANREPFSEEVNWLAAAEWADKNGAHIINSSLGYTNARYFPWQMNGKSTFVAKAANIAARKGILVVNAAGNDGSGSWKKLGTPADADSVLTVGGISPDTDFHTDFSSYGPTADFRIKPNVCAFGHVIAAAPNGFTRTQGTSFASPLVAGFAACAMQSRPGIKTMELFHEIEKSGDLYPYYDYAHGYGVPQASYFLTKTETDSTATEAFETIIENGWLKVKVNKEILIKNKRYNLLFYNIENVKGYLDKYFVIDVKTETPLHLSLSDLKKGDKINIHFKGRTYTYINK